MQAAAITVLEVLDGESAELGVARVDVSAPLSAITPSHLDQAAAGKGFTYLISTSSSSVCL